MQDIPMTQPRDEIQAFGIRLGRLQQGQIELVRQWRNHPEVARYMLSQEPISAAQQQAWFDRIQAANDRRYYLIHWQDQPSGFASVTSTDGVPLTQAEDLEAAIYFAPDSPLRGNLLAFAPALALNDACFAQLPAQRLLARVKPDNQAALRFNQAMGYRQIGEENGLILLAMNTADYQRASQSIRALLNRPTRGAVA
jgi:RimJ/RimL family protein N-acetyltransferase